MFEKFTNTFTLRMFGPELLLLILMTVGISFPSAARSAEAAAESSLPWYLDGFAPIGILLVAIGIVLWRLPKIKLHESDPIDALDHLTNPEYVRRRMWNWLMLGISYAFLYFGRYNITVAKNYMGYEDANDVFNTVFAVGTAVYGLAFILNGPLTDKLGGRFSILIGTIGAALANAALGVICVLHSNDAITTDQLVTYMTVFYGINMYFQSFGAVAIVKTNSRWFHVSERGSFGAIFGILISLGIYFAFDWTSTILETWEWSVQWAYFAPAILLTIMFLVDLLVVKNSPAEAGLHNIPTGDGSEGEEDMPQLPPQKVLWMMLGNWVIVCIAIIEFCSGFLRQAIMHQYKNMMYAVPHLADTFIAHKWGTMLCVAGILGGVFAGQISDRVFNARRGPVAAFLYAGMIVISVWSYYAIDSVALGPLMIFASMFVIGVHGMLSGTASMDFAGSKNTGIAVGLIDAFVYFGSSLQSVIYGNTLPADKHAPGADDPQNWITLPKFMIIFAVVGTIFAFLIRNQKPKPRKKNQQSLPNPYRIHRDATELPTEEVV
jgi:OPA family glycerol-3-phosphate transporter-like MFS transporter